MYRRYDDRDPYRFQERKTMSTYSPNSRNSTLAYRPEGDGTVPKGLLKLLYMFMNVRETMNGDVEKLLKKFDKISDRLSPLDDKFNYEDEYERWIRYPIEDFIKAVNDAWKELDEHMEAGEQRLPPIVADEHSIEREDFYDLLW